MNVRDLGVHTIVLDAFLDHLYIHFSVNLHDSAVTEVFSDNLAVGVSDAPEIALDTPHLYNIVFINSLSLGADFVTWLQIPSVQSQTWL